MTAESEMCSEKMTLSLLRNVIMSIRQTMQNGDNYLRDGYLKGPDCRTVSDRAPPCFATHALFNLYFAHSTSSLFKPTTTTAMARGRASWVASTAMLLPR